MQENWCLNGVAVAGDMSHWTYANVVATNDGFVMSGSAYLTQEHIVGLAITDDQLSVAFDYFFNKPYNPLDNKLYAYVCIVVLYADSTSDVFNFPMRTTLTEWYSIEESFSVDASKEIDTVAIRPVTFGIPVTLTINNIEFGLATRMLNDVVELNKLYHGIKITETEGLVATREDLLARAFFNSDTLAMQRGNGSGSWTNVLYFDTDEGTFVFDGVLAAGVVDVNSLYASSATIAQLTVDQLETGNKVQRYLNNDVTDVNYIKIRDQYMQFITASTDGSAHTHLQNRDGQSLYWTDDTHKYTTTTTTSFPVYIYVYTELIKREEAFIANGSNYVPQSIYGAGSGNTADSGKTFVYKATDGFYIDYRHSVTGNPTIFKITDAGIDLTAFPSVIYSDSVIVQGMPRIWIENEISSSMTDKDVFIDTDDYSRYDELLVTAAAITITAQSPEMITLNTVTTPYIEVHYNVGTQLGVYKSIHNIGTGYAKIVYTYANNSLVRLSGLPYSDVSEFYLLPGESIDLFTVTGGV